MINRLLFFILTRIYRVDPKMCNPINWRIAHPGETISKILGYEPLIFKAWQGQVQYGFENFVFLAAGQVYLCPNVLKDKYYTGELHEPKDFFDKQLGIPYSLFKHYMENEPNILVKKFPTKILRFILKRHIKIQKKIIKQQQNEKNDSSIMSVSDAIKSDLSSGKTTDLPGTPINREDQFYSRKTD